MVKSLKSPEYQEFLNNWVPIDFSNDWLRQYDETTESIYTSMGNVRVWGGNMGHNSGSSYVRITTVKDYIKYRLISFSCNMSALCTHGNNHVAYLQLTDGVSKTFTLMSSVAVADSKDELAVAGGYFTLEVNGNIVTIRRTGFTRLIYDADGSATLVADEYQLDISTWTALKVRLQVGGNARSGYGSADGVSQIALSPILTSKKVMGSKKRLSSVQ
jgi:hypothetical protein